CRRRSRGLLGGLQPVAAAGAGGGAVGGAMPVEGFVAGAAAVGVRSSAVRAAADEEEPHLAAADGAGQLRAAHRYGVLGRYSGSRPARLLVLRPGCRRGVLVAHAAACPFCRLIQASTSAQSQRSWVPTLNARAPIPTPRSEEHT